MNVPQTFLFVMYVTLLESHERDPKRAQPVTLKKWCLILSLPLLMSLKALRASVLKSWFSNLEGL